MDLAAQIVETWGINNRLNLYLLDAIAEDLLATPLAKGKKVGDQFAHIHNVRLAWLKASAPDLWEGQTKLENATSKEEIKQALKMSGDAISTLLERGLETGKVKNFKPHATAFLGYLIAHESNHRGHAELALRQAGVPLDDKISYGVWEWGNK